MAPLSLWSYLCGQPLLRNGARYELPGVLPPGTQPFEAGGPAGEQKDPTLGQIPASSAVATQVSQLKPPLLGHKQGWERLQGRNEHLEGPSMATRSR